jgi:hypothetical protein
MDEANLIEKIGLICENFGEKFSKGYYFVADNVKFKTYGLDKLKRVRVIEGKNQVFNYLDLRGKEFYTDFIDGKWGDVVNEYWTLLNREYKK